MIDVTKSLQDQFVAEDVMNEIKALVGSVEGKERREFLQSLRKRLIAEITRKSELTEADLFYLLQLGVRPKP